MQVLNNAVFEEKEPLRFYDCDYKCRMKLSAILKRSAEIAGRDYTLKGFGHEVLWEKQMVFLLSRVSARIFNYPHEQSDLTTRTWEHGTKGAMFLRATEIVDENNKIAVSLNSGWVLANPVTRHIYKPSHFDFDMPQDFDKPIHSVPLEKIKYTELKLQAQREVRKTDLDANGHVYNAVYADMASDALPKSIYEKDIRNFRINYIAEAVLGDILDLYAQENENSYIIIAFNKDKICFECEFMF